MIEKKSTIIISKILANGLLIIAAASCIIPFLTVLSSSFSNEAEIIEKGYSIFPRGFSIEAYKSVFANIETIVKAYMVTILTTAAGALLSTLITAMAGYPLSRGDYQWKKFFNFYIYFTMIFSGGAIASYLWITQGLHLRDNPLVLILPLLGSGYNIFLMRTYMSKIPGELVEAAKIDGASEFKILFSIIMPMSTVGLATIFLMTALTYWNQWYASLMYFNTDAYTTLQYYLIRVMNNIEEILSNKNSMVVQDASKMPGETARMAMCVVSAGPMIFVFAFFQKYFVSGIAVGSVKG